MNKTINQLPNAAVIATDQFEKQVTGGGASQNCTSSQLLTFIENNVTFIVKKTDFQAGLSVAAGTALLNQDGSAAFASSVIIISASGDIEITTTTKGLILWSPNGTRFRIQVDDGGNLGTVPA